jgi:hypothetical protein
MNANEISKADTQWPFIKITDNLIYLIFRFSNRSVQSKDWFILHIDDLLSIDKQKRLQLLAMFW